MPAKKPITDALRKAIQDSGLSMLEIERRTGVSNPVLNRFMRGKRGLTLATVDTLAAHFGLELTRRRKSK